MSAQYLNLADTTDATLIAGIYQRLVKELGAVGMWLGLPEAIAVRADIPGACPLVDILEWLPVSARLLVAQGERGQVGDRLSLPDSVAHSLPLKDLDKGGLFWEAVPLSLENYPPAILLIVRLKPVDQVVLGDDVDEFLGMLSLYIEHALYKGASNRYRSNLEALHTVSVRMANTLDLEEVLHLLVESTLELIPADAVFIYIFQPGMEAGSTYSLGAAHGVVGEKRKASATPVPDEVLSLITGRGWPLIISRVRGHSVYQPLADAGWEINALAGYPLTRGGRLLGVFVLSFLEEYRLTSLERYLLSLLSDQAVIAIDRARVAGNLSTYQSQMSALSRLAHLLDASRELEKNLDEFVLVLKDLFSVSMVSILLQGEDQELEQVALTHEGDRLADTSPLLLSKQIAKRVIIGGEKVYIPDLHEDGQITLTDPDIRSLMVIPLSVRDQVMGLLFMGGYQPSAFGPEAERLLAIVTLQLSIAIQNARLCQGEARKAEELRAMIELSRFITRNLDIEHVFDAAHRAIQRLMPSHAFLIAVRDLHTREAINTYLIDQEVRYRPRPSAKGGLSEYVIESGESIYIQDLEAEQPPFTVVHFGSEEHVRSVMAVTLQSGTQIIGMVSVQSYQPHAYSQGDLELFHSIADHIAIAVENSNLYADLESRFQNLEEANRLRLEFTQNLAHEMNTPLTFLQAYVEMMLSGELGELNDRQRETLSVLQTKTASLVRLVKDIATLEMSGRDWLQIQDVDLLKLVQEAVFLADEAASQREITIRLSTPSEFPNMRADPDRVAQVLDNLLSNAIKYGYPESEIVVLLKAESERAVVSIFNQGDAILKHDQERLFERFYQGEHRQKGLGLGLAIVRHIVEAHGGKVWIESQTDVGNTFCIALPYQNAQNSEGARQ